MAGYDTAPGLASVASDSTTNRTIAAINANGTVNTATGIIAGSAYKKNNIRGAATQDGTAFWCSGAGSGTTGGTWYVPSGSFTSSPIDISSTISSTRAINVFNGQLYASASSSSYHGVNTIGTGIPVTAGQTSTNLPGLPAADTASSAYGFYFFDMDPNTPGDDVVYVCDDRSGSTAGLLKYSLVSGTWVFNGNISSTYDLRGVTGYATCKGVKLFISGQGGVFSLGDTSGYNKPITGTLNQLVTPATNTIIRGIAFAPGITGPVALQVNAVPANLTCNGAGNGSVTVTITGGTSPFTFSWSSTATTQNINNLSAGNYSITVSDAGSCTASASASVTEPNVLGANAVATNVTCNGGADGSVALTVSGGTTGYTYSWSNTSTTQNLSAVGNATYTVTVTDNHSCTVTTSAVVSQPSAITIVATVTNLPCTGGANTGAVNIAVTGGAAGYTYLWSNQSTTPNITGLNANTYAVTVTDASHCTASQTAIVSQSGNMALSIVVTNVKCNGGSDGAITVTASGGTPAYNYAWSTGNNNQPQTGLTAATYTVTVSDNGGCTLTNDINVSQPSAIAAVLTQTNVGCYGASTGATNLSVSGGTTPYTFSWSNSATTQNLTSITASNYTVTVTDSNNCTATASGIITQPDSISISGVVTNATSFGAADGSISLSVSGGTSGYTYTWNTGSGADNTLLPAGNYCVTVTDAHNCAATECYTVSQPNGISELSIVNNLLIYSVGNNLNVDADLATFGSYTIQLSDIIGRPVFRSSPTLASHIQLSIPISNVSSGCYIATIHTEEGSLSKKIIIAH